MNVLEYYHQTLEERGYRSDEAQLNAIERLQVYFDDWINFKKARSSSFKKIFRRPDVPRGVYLWGGVGRGKSFLMDA
ncbi:MAG TPA: AFG1/ZapE family ATPase, partial [Candidimonas sp.]|nr:AFG1/ZapE family ATPase [Candidimonas sp.]